MVESGVGRRVFAAIQVFLVSGIPTQIIVFGLLIGTGSVMGADGTWVTADPNKISLQFFAMSSLLDTALIAIFIRVLLAISGERSHDVFLGNRRTRREMALGLALIPALYGLVIVMTLAVQTWFPSLHNVAKNPFEAYMDTPLKAGVFIMVVMLAGGVREELQRAFIIHRFEQSLGGAWVGLLIYGVIFSLFHVQQGIDVALIVGVLGLVWGLLYIRRRSAVANMVSHAGFDVAQVLLRSLST